MQRRRVRREATAAESALWGLLRGRRVAGFEFRRQHPCGPFVLDFFCPARRLAIELDGGHPCQVRGDTHRAAFIAARGISILRFPRDQVFRETNAVLMTIAFALAGDRP